LFASHQVYSFVVCGVVHCLEPFSLEVIDSELPSPFVGTLLEDIHTDGRVSYPSYDPYSILAFKLLALLLTIQFDLINGDDLVFRVLEPLGQTVDFCIAFILVKVLLLTLGEALPAAHLASQRDAVNLLLLLRMPLFVLVLIHRTHLLLILRIVPHLPQARHPQLFFLVLVHVGCVLERLRLLLTLGYPFLISYLIQTLRIYVSLWIQITNGVVDGIVQVIDCCFLHLLVLQCVVDLLSELEIFFGVNLLEGESPFLVSVALIVPFYFLAHCTLLHIYANVFGHIQRLKLVIFFKIHQLKDGAAPDSLFQIFLPRQSLIEFLALLRSIIA